MKRTLLLFSAVALFLMSSCSKDVSEADQKAVIQAIFTAGMSWNSQEKAAITEGLKSSYPINYSIDEYVSGPEGGSIHVFGTVTGTMLFDDATYSVIGGTMLIGLTETINDYGFESEGDVYVMNGDPYISLTGTFSLLGGGNTFGTASSMQIGGGVHVAGPRCDQTLNMNITINVNADGSGGDVSGTVNGVPLNYSF